MVIRVFHRGELLQCSLVTAIGIRNRYIPLTSVRILSRW
jgi:hypothetical protein